MNLADIVPFLPFPFTYHYTHRSYSIRKKNLLHGRIISFPSTFSSFFVRFPIIYSLVEYRPGTSRVTESKPRARLIFSYAAVSWERRKSGGELRRQDTRLNFIFLGLVFRRFFFIVSPGNSSRLLLRRSKRRGWLQRRRVRILFKHFRLPQPLFSATLSRWEGER